VQSLVPSYAQGFARCAAESEYPGLWHRLRAAWVSALGNTGSSVHNVVSGGEPMVMQNMVPSAAWAVGQHGWYLHGDGTGADNLETSTSYLQDDFTKFSMVCRWRGAWSNTKGHLGRVVNAGDGSLYLGCGNGANEIRFLVNGVTANANCEVVDATVWGTTQWNVSIGIRYAANDHKLFVNGIESATSAVNTGSIAPLAPNGWSLLSLVLNEFIGDVDVGLFYDRALTPPELMQLGTDPVAPFRLRRRVYAASAAPPLPVVASNQGSSMPVKRFRLDTKSAGAQALEGLWGPGPPGDLLYDMSAKGRGAGNHATRVGAGGRTQLSARGRVLLFNGVDDVWNTERPLGIGAASFTICAWVWLDSTVATAGASIAGSGDAGAGEWMFRVSPSSGVGAALSPYADAGGITPSAAAGTFHVVKEEWVHVAWNRDAAGVSNVYQNGVYMATDVTAADNLNTAKVMTIGGADGHATRWWKGMMDDVRYYSRALSLGEIGHIYNATRYQPYADIALGWIRRHGRPHRGHIRRVKP